MKNKITGILEIKNGKGFLRNAYNNFEIEKTDLQIPKELLNKYNLNDGCMVTVSTINNKFEKIDNINNLEPEKYKNIKLHKDLTSINPNEQIMIGQNKSDSTGRLIDRLIPIAKGQRGLIISPSKTGKTTIIQHIAKSISLNYPEMKLAILLVDERPEEITDFSRELPNALVFHSSADMSQESHMRIASLSLEMATRMLEVGDDVFVLIDSLTRLSRASNKESKSNRTMSGGLGINAMEIPRRLFGRAKNVENGGSLTIIASILVETGSRMDDMIFQEFKGTGNWDLKLSRELSEKRIYPAIDISESSTRKEHLILPPRMLEKSNDLRRKVVDLQPDEALKTSLKYLK